MEMIRCGALPAPQSQGVSQSQRALGGRQESYSWELLTLLHVLGPHYSVTPVLQVRAEDQKKICEFGILNARVSELRDELAEVKKTLEGYEDAEAEVALADADGEGATFMYVSLPVQRVAAPRVWVLMFSWCLSQVAAWRVVH